MNRNERTIFEHLTGQGFTVLRNGWPDFLVTRPATNEGFGLELKCGPDQLSTEQVQMHDALRAMGLPVLICRDGLDNAAALEGHKIAFRAKRTSLLAKMRALEGQMQELRAELDGSAVLFEDPEHLIQQSKYANAVKGLVRIGR